MLASPRDATGRAGNSRHTQRFPKVELRPPVLDLRNGSLRDAAERPIKCWDRPAMLRGEPTSVVNQLLIDRGMGIGPVSGGAGRACIFTPRSGCSRVAIKMVGSPRDPAGPVGNRIDICSTSLTNDVLPSRCSGASRQISARPMKRLATTSAQTFFERRAVAASPKHWSPVA